VNETEDLLVQRDGGELWLRFNRPQARNAINWNIRRALPRVRTVIIAGTEVAFCSGGDIKEMGRGWEDSKAKLEFASDIVQCIARMPKPVIAAVQGHVAGAGIGLALSCDLIYASETAVISPAFVHRGISPDMSSSYWLTRALGIAKAKQVLLNANQIGAEEALALGLFAEVLAADGFEEQLRARVGRLSNGPTVAIAQIKRLVNAAAGNDLAAQLALETEAQELVVATEDHHLAIQAFKEKRTPRFTGR
jgi:2-(1,2-epoxy-1,2-dihydrophenyl)acetyl-CoA isomerase